MRPYSQYSLLAGLLCLPVLSAAQPDHSGLQRLFYTVEQRQLLDQPPAAPTAARQTEPRTQAATAPTAIQIHGIVQKKHGTRTVWMNQRKIKLLPNAALEPHQVEVQLQPQQPAITIKVGQQLSTP